MDGSSIVLIFQIQGYERIGILDTVYEITTSLYHSLVDELLERFFRDGNTHIIEELVPETGINKVAGSMFGTADVKVDALPIPVDSRVYKCLVVVWVHIAQIIG